MRLDPNFIGDDGQIPREILKGGKPAKRVGYFGDLERITRQLIRKCGNAAEGVGQRRDAKTRIVPDRRGIAGRVRHLGHKDFARIGGRSVAERENLLRTV